MHEDKSDLMCITANEDWYKLEQLISCNASLSTHIEAKKKVMMEADQPFWNTKRLKTMKAGVTRH